MLSVCAMVGCTLGELGERMTAEELNLWLAMVRHEWVGPARQSQLLAMIAAGVRNPPLKGPKGEGSIWTVDDILPPDRWDPPKPQPQGGLSLAAIKGWFGQQFGFK